MVPTAGSGASPRSRFAALAVPLWLLSFAIVLVTVALLTAAVSPGTAHVDASLLTFLAIPLTFGTVGGVVAARRPESYAGWCLLGMAIAFGLDLLLVVYVGVAAPPSRLGWPGAQVAAWVSDLAFVPIIGTFATIFLLHFPDGRLPRPRWRAAVYVLAAGVAIGAVGEGLRPGAPNPDFPMLLNPVAAPDSFAGVLDLARTLGNIGVVGAAILAAASLIARYRSARPAERAQIRWIAVVGIGLAVAFAVAALQISPVSDVAFLGGFMLIAVLPITIGIAITRYRLYEIDHLVNRAIVYGFVTAILAGIFAASITLSQRAFIGVSGQSSDAAIVITTLIITAAYTPVRRRVEAVVDHWLKFDSRLFGPYRAHLATTLEVLDPAAGRQRLLREAMRELRASGAAIVAAGGGTLAQAGAWADGTTAVVALPLGATGARLVLGPPGRSRPYSPDAIRALAEVATLAARTIALADGREAAHDDAAQRVAAAATTATTAVAEAAAATDEATATPVAVPSVSSP